MAEDKRITRNDLESRFREIKDGVDQQAFAAKNKAVPVAVGLGVVVLVLVYIIGKRVGRKTSSIVEIRRL
jgi:hypothetical protein